MEEDRPRGALCWPCAVRCRPPCRRSRAGAHRIPLGRLLGYRGRLRAGGLRCTTDRGRRAAGGARQRLRPVRNPHREERGAFGRDPRSRTPVGAHRPRVHGSVGRPEAEPAPAQGALHDLVTPAGGLEPPALGIPAHDARGAGALRERLHHLYAHRLHKPVGAGDQCGPFAGGGALRPRVRLGASAPLRQEGEERSGGP